LKDRIRILPRLALAAVVLVVATGIIGPLVILVSLVTSGGPAYRLQRWWAWLVSKSMGLSFSLHGKDKIVPGTSYIITPNHQSNADILALIRILPPRFRWVIKKELTKIPVFGWALASTGAIAIDRSDPKQSVQTLQKATDKLKGSWSVLIYPEGTRTQDGRLQRLKKGAFMMAVQTGIPILPVTSNGAFKVLPKKTVWFRPGHITVTLGDPIVTAGLTEKDVPDLMERTRAAISKNLDPDYDPFGKS
jgi:1-acyl-sn-glycerol-3-phosphate acyltransferase